MMESSSRPVGGPSAKLNVLFVTFQLGGGGAEMQMLRIANSLNRERFKVSIAVFRRGGNYEKLLREDVSLYDLGGGGAIRAIVALRTLIQTLKPHLVCPFLDIPAVAAWIAAHTCNVRPKVVACVQAPPTIVFRMGRPLSAKRLFLRVFGRILPRMDRIIAISHGVAEDLANLSPHSRIKTEVIHNIGVDENLTSAMQERPKDQKPKGALLIVACGRLTPQKGFTDLLDAFALVRAKRSAALWIIGEGEERAILEGKIAELGLVNCARLLGFRENPFAYFAVADVFALSSVYEGFGNVVVEAMACGAPVVSTDCPYGPSEIITDGVDGLLVPPSKPEALADGILELLDQPQRTRALAKRGRDRAQDFAVGIITERYERVFEAVAGSGV